MRAGSLRHRIIIETKEITKDSTYGEEVVKWSSNVGAWASISPLRGRLYFEASQVQSAATHKINMRYATLSASTQIRPGHCRAKYGDRVFTITHVANVDERNINLELYCTEEVG